MARIICWDLDETLVNGGEPKPRADLLLEKLSQAGFTHALTTYHMGDLERLFDKLKRQGIDLKRHFTRIWQAEGIVTGKWYKSYSKVAQAFYVDNPQEEMISVGDHAFDASHEGEVTHIHLPRHTHFAQDSYPLGRALEELIKTGGFKTGFERLWKQGIWELPSTDGFEPLHRYFHNEEAPLYTQEGLLQKRVKRKDVSFTLEYRRNTATGATQRFIHHLEELPRDLDTLFRET